MLICLLLVVLVVIAKLGVFLPGQSVLRLGTDLALYLLVNKVSNLEF